MIWSGAARPAAATKPQGPAREVPGGIPIYGEGHPRALELAEACISPTLRPPPEAVVAVEKTVEGRRPQRLDFPGYAQEFLRRSPDYRRDYDSVMSDRHAGPAAQEGMARRWGLCFPGRSATFGA